MRFIVAARLGANALLFASCEIRSGNCRWHRDRQFVTSSRSFSRVSTGNGQAELCEKPCSGHVSRICSELIPIGIILFSLEINRNPGNNWIIPESESIPSKSVIRVLFRSISREKKGKLSSVWILNYFMIDDIIS